MKYTFFPGCSLESTARDFYESTISVAKALGVELVELPKWTCCGSTPAHSVDATLAVALPARNLAEAAKLGHDLVVVCAACYSRLQTANLAMKNDKDIRAKVEDVSGIKYTGEVRVRHLLEVLITDFGIDSIAKKVKKPLNGLSVASYYGCLLARPRELSIFDDPENPTLMDDLVGALGAESITWPHSTECCGGSFSITNTGAVEKLGKDILDMAKLAGANCFATACPLCQSNLDLRQKDIEAKFNSSYNMPVFYFTQLLGLALGLPEKSLGLDRLFVSPKEALGVL